MATCIYVENDDDNLLNIILTALHSRHYIVEQTTTSHSRSSPVHTDIALYYRENPSAHTLTVGDITLDIDNVCVRIHDEDIHLTPIEFQTLQFLMNNAHRAVSRKELFPLIWHMEYDGTSRVADDTIKRLRKKLSNASTTIKTIWNFGFRLSTQK